MRTYRALIAFLCLAALIAIPASVFADTSFNLFLSQLEQQYQLPSGILAKVAQIESGGNATVCASTSSACGLFQFTTNTWLSVTKAMYSAPLSLSERSDPTESAKATAFELAEIRSQIGTTITQANVDMSVGLYLGHFLGAGGARQLLIAYMQNPGESACSLLPKACAANRSILSQSVSGVINHFAQLMQKPGVVNVAGNFAGSNGVSYAYSSADLNSANFLPASTVIGVDPQYDYPPVFTSVTSAPLSPTAGTGTAIPNAPQNPLPTNYTTPPQAAQALAAAASASSSGACTPQYYCSNNTDYYESNACVTTTFEQCQYGCLGTICAPQPAASSTTGTASSVQTISNIPDPTLGNSETPTASFFATSTEIGTTSSILSTGFFSIDDDATATPIGTDGTAVGGEESTTSGIQGEPGFLTNDFDQNVYMPAPASPMTQLLGQLKTVLVGLLSYLQSL